jgi:hypothetical protein
MAATGLLGINPYFKGVNIDTSKPVNLAIQLQQKEMAKQEALDKYFMDYEKSINPAGMRSVDQDNVLKKLNNNKQFYLRNRERILNPSKYGAEYQSQYMAGFKDILSDISKSKEATANNKIAQQYYYQAQQKGLETPDGYLQAVQKSQLPINNGYEPIDAFKWHFDTPFSTEKFQRDIFAGIEPDKKNVGSRTNNQGQVINIYENQFDKDSLRTFANRAVSQYRTNPVVSREVNRLIKTGEYKDLQPYYEKLNPKMSIDNADPADVAAAFALSLKQLGKTTESAPVFRPGSQNAAVDEYDPEGHLDRIIGESPKKGESGYISSITVNGKIVEGMKIDLPEVLKNKYGMKEDNTTIKPNYFLITKNKGTLYPVYVQGKTKSGNDEIMTGDPISVVNDLLPSMGETYAGKSFLRKNFPNSVDSGKDTQDENITVVIDGKSGIIPAKQWNAFKKKYPNAKKQ